MIRDSKGVSLRKPPLDTFTMWGNPNEVIESEYGPTTYQVWCEAEIKRIGVLGKTVVIRTADDGEIALAEVNG